MSLPDVAQGDPHVSSHNDERHVINAIQDVTDPDFVTNLTPVVSGVAVPAAQEAAADYLADEPGVVAATEAAVDARVAAEDLLAGTDQRAPKKRAAGWLFPNTVGGIFGPSGYAWLQVMLDGFMEYSKVRVTRLLEVAGLTLRPADPNTSGDILALGGPSGRSVIVVRESGALTLTLAEDAVIPESLVSTSEVVAARGSQVSLATRLGHGLDSYGMTRDYQQRVERLRWTRMLLEKLRYGDATTKFVLALIGDSYTHSATRWSGPFWDALKDEFGDGGVGWVGFSWISNTGLRNGSVRSDTTVNTTGTWTVPNYYGTRSPDLGELQSVNAGDTIVVTFPAGQTSCKLHYIATAGAAITSQFNGTGSAANAVNLATGVAGELAVATLVAPAADSTTLTLTVTSGTVILCGVDLRNSSNGIVVHKLGSSGSASTHWAAAAATTSWRTAMASLNPDGVDVMLGTNDQGAARAPSAYVANLGTLFTGCDAALTNTGYDRALLMPPENNRVNAVPMSDYAKAAQEFADTVDAAILNLQDPFGNVAADYAFGSNRPWFSSDLVHPDPLTGGRVISSGVRRFTVYR